MQHAQLAHPILLNNAVNNNCQQLQVNSSSPGSTTSDSDNHLNNIHANISNNQGSNNHFNEADNIKQLQGQDHMNILQQKHEKQIIAKPLPSRPTPFIAHGINHPHLHSLLAHCRNPYMTGGYLKYKTSIHKLTMSKFRCFSSTRFSNDFWPGFSLGSL